MTGDGRAHLRSAHLLPRRGDRRRRQQAQCGDREGTGRGERSGRCPDPALRVRGQGARRRGHGRGRPNRNGDAHHDRGDGYGHARRVDAVSNRRSGNRGATARRRPPRPPRGSGVCRPRPMARGCQGGAAGCDPARPERATRPRGLVRAVVAPPTRLRRPAPSLGRNGTHSFGCGIAPRADRARSHRALQQPPAAGWLLDEGQPARARPSWSLTDSTWSDPRCAAQPSPC